MADISSLLGAAGIGGAIGKAIVSLELSTAKYNAELAAAEGKTTASANTMSSGFSKLGGVGQTALLGISAGAVALAVKSVGAFQEVGAEVRTLEKQLGITAEAASVLRAQGAALGVGVDKLSIGFGLFSKHLAAEDDPALEKWGITVDRAADGSIDFQAEIAQVHALFERLGPGVDRTAASMELFGRSGKSLLPLLGASSDELAKFADEAERAGLILSEDDVTASREFAIAQRELGEALKGLEVSLGRELIPAMKELAATAQDILDPIASIVDKINGLTGESDKAGFSIGGLYHGLVDLANPIEAVIHPIGRFQEAWRDATGTGEDFNDVLGGQLGVIGDLSEFYRGKFSEALTDAGKATSRFAHMTTKELAEWSDSTKESFDTAILAMSETEKQTIITRQEFMRSSRLMQREAEDLSEAMKTIAQSKWVPDAYVKFLSEQGPEWLVGFANLTETQQHRAVQAWRQSTTETDNAKTSLDKITGALDDIGKGKSTHTVTIKYDYVGFDPSKPGMAAGQTGGAASNQQR